MNNNPHLCSASQLTHSFLMQHLIYDQQKLRQGSKGSSPPQFTDEKLESQRGLTELTVAMLLIT